MAKLRAFKSQGLMDISMLGDKELKRQFDSLGRKMQKKFLRKALRAGGKAVQVQWKANVPVDTGAYKTGIRVRAMKRSRRGVGINVSSPPRSVIAKIHGKKAERAFFRGDIRGAFRHESKGAATDEWYYPAVQEYGGVKKNGTVIPPGGHGRRAFRVAKDRSIKITGFSLWQQILSDVRTAVKVAA